MQIQKTTLIILSCLLFVTGILVTHYYYYFHQHSATNPISNANNPEKFFQIEVLTIRLAPFQDLRKSLDSLVNLNHIEAGCILSCAGSLRQAAIRYADKNEATILSGKFEIVSLSGTLSKNGSHLHLAISDGTGKTFGGHLMAGCRIYTTAEIVIGIFPDLRFLREHDAASGYNELTIYRK
ncbi:DNA-binding protein [candidate division KSB1 bacterium]|nr:DNA-binding protein [candidate division KSB1 bacterium]